MIVRRSAKQPLPERDEYLRDARNMLRRVMRTCVDGSPEPTDIQYEICDEMQKTFWRVVFGVNHPEGPPEQRRQNVIVEAMRGIGKSLIAQVICEWALYWNQSLNIIVQSANERFAVQFSTAVLGHIRMVPELEWMYPSPEQRSSVLQFDVAYATDPQHPSFKSVGIDGMVVGSRGSMIIDDDVEIDSNTATDMLRDRLEKKIEDLEMVRKTVSAVMLLGTPHAELSTYNKLAAEKGYRRVMWPARYPDKKWMETPVGNSASHTNGDDLSTLIKSRLSLDPLLGAKEMKDNPNTDSRIDEYVLADQLKKTGRSKVAMQMLLDTSLADANRYPLKLSDFIVMDFGAEKAPVDLVWSNDVAQWISDLPSLGLPGDRYYRPLIKSNELGRFEGSIMAIDPSGMGGDAMGVCITRMLGARIFVPLLTGIHGGFVDANLIRICELAKAHGVKKIVTEKNLGAGMFTALLLATMKTHYPECAIEDFNSVGQKEQRIIDTLEPVMQQHRVVLSTQVVRDDLLPIPGIDAEDRYSYSFARQLTRITRVPKCLPHDDLADALAMGVAHWTEYMANTTQQAQENTKQRNIEEMIAAWYRTSDQPALTHRYGHSTSTQGFIERQRAQLNRRR